MRFLLNICAQTLSLSLSLSVVCFLLHFSYSRRRDTSLEETFVGARSRSNFSNGIFHDGSSRGKRRRGDARVCQKYLHHQWSKPKLQSSQSHRARRSANAKDIERVSLSLSRRQPAAELIERWKRGKLVNMKTDCTRLGPLPRAKYSPAGGRSEKVASHRL